MKINKDLVAMEEAYLSMKKKISSVPSDDIDVSTNPNEEIYTGAEVTEPAPGTIDTDPTAIDNPDTTGTPVDMSPVPLEDPTISDIENDESHQMSIENLSSIRDSVLKIASRCASGDTLEAWAQQKLAIAMDNLSEVARRCCS